MDFCQIVVLRGCVVNEKNSTLLLEERSAEMSSVVADGCWVPVVPNLLQHSIGSEVSELSLSCHLNW